MFHSWLPSSGLEGPKGVLNMQAYAQVYWMEFFLVPVCTFVVVDKIYARITYNTTLGEHYIKIKCTLLSCTVQGLLASVSISTFHELVYVLLMYPGTFLLN